MIQCGDLDKTSEQNSDIATEDDKISQQLRDSKEILSILPSRLPISYVRLSWLFEVSIVHLCNHHVFVAKPSINANRSRRGTSTSSICFIQILMTFLESRTSSFTILETEDYGPLDEINILTGMRHFR